MIFWLLAPDNYLANFTYKSGLNKDLYIVVVYNYGFDYFLVILGWSYRQV